MGAILCPLQVDNHKEGPFAEGELQRASQLACFCNAQLENLPASVTSMARMLCGKDLNHAKVKYAIFGKHSLLKLQAKMKDFKRRQVGNELKAREPRHRGVWPFMPGSQRLMHITGRWMAQRLFS